MAVKLWQLFSVEMYCPLMFLSVVVKAVLASHAAGAARHKHRDIADTSQANSVIPFSLGESCSSIGLCKSRDAFIALVLKIHLVDREEKVRAPVSTSNSPSLVINQEWPVQ